MKPLSALQVIVKLAYSIHPSLGSFFLSSVEFINIFQINSTTATACNTIAKRLSEKSSLVLKESVLQQWKNVDYLIQ